MSPALPTLRLRVRAQGRHPWFYRKMVRKPETRIDAGAAVHVEDRTGRPVGTGFYNPRSELALRMISDGKVENTQGYLLDALDRAIELRLDRLRLRDVTDGFRLVHAEGDGFPGLILDRLGDVLVAQVFSLAMQERMEAIGEALLRRWPKARLVMLQDSKAAEREGMPKIPRAPALQTTVTEHGIRYAVQPGSGHKTGFFADQRENRWLLHTMVEGRRVLDLCCNSGGFAMQAVRGGARSVVAVDLDEAMVAQTQQNAVANDLSLIADHGDAFDTLRATKPGSVDCIVLDPPKWVADKHGLEAGLDRYRDLNRGALAVLDRGGMLVSCSCSGAVSEMHFIKTIREAAAQARRDVRIMASRGAGPDHPVALECPETRYLKVLFLEVR